MRVSVIIVLPLLLALVTVVGCGEARDRLSGSNGRPYEIVLVGDTDSIVSKMLQRDVAALPQAEPMFDVLSISAKDDHGSWLLARTRIVVHVGKQYGFSVERILNVRARPQMELVVTAPSPVVLQAKVNVEKLMAMLDQWELRHLAKTMKQDVRRQEVVAHTFGVSLKIPATMKSGKETKDFLWISNNANSGMQNLLVFRVEKPEKDMTSQIQRMLEKNIIGEEDGMYMQISSMEAYTTFSGMGMMRGLWYMEGDAMGGPYIMRIIPKGDSAIVAMGFVYAPEMKKRNLIKQLEAVLQTMEAKGNQTTNNNKYKI